MQTREALLDRVISLANQTSDAGLEEIVLKLESLSKSFTPLYPEHESRIERAMEDVEAGRLYSAQEVKAEIAKMRGAR
jgi:predicted transcriptional regulator